MRTAPDRGGVVVGGVVVGGVVVGGLVVLVVGGAVVVGGLRGAGGGWRGGGWRGGGWGGGPRVTDHLGQGAPGRLGTAVTVEQPEPCFEVSAIRAVAVVGVEVDALDVGPVGEGPNDGVLDVAGLLGLGDGAICFGRRAPSDLGDPDRLAGAEADGGLSYQLDLAVVPAGIVAVDVGPVLLRVRVGVQAEDVDQALERWLGAEDLVDPSRRRAVMAGLEQRGLHHDLHRRIGGVDGLRRGSGHGRVRGRVGLVPPRPPAPGLVPDLHGRHGLGGQFGMLRPEGAVRAVPSNNGPGVRGVVGVVARCEVLVAVARRVRRGPRGRVVEDPEHLDPGPRCGGHHRVRTRPVELAPLRLDGVPVEVLPHPGDPAGREAAVRGAGVVRTEPEAVAVHAHAAEVAPAALGLCRRRVGSHVPEDADHHRNDQAEGQTGDCPSASLERHRSSPFRRFPVPTSDGLPGVSVGVLAP